MISNKCGVLKNNMPLCGTFYFVTAFIFRPFTVVVVNSAIPNSKVFNNNTLIDWIILTLSCPGTRRAIVKIGPSNLRPGSKELIFSAHAGYTGTEAC